MPAASALPLGEVRYGFCNASEGKPPCRNIIGVQKPFWSGSAGNLARARGLRKSSDATRYQLGGVWIPAISLNARIIHRRALWLLGNSLTRGFIANSYWQNRRKNRGTNDGAVADKKIEGHTRGQRGLGQGLAAAGGECVALKALTVTPGMSELTATKVLTR